MVDIDAFVLGSKTIRDMLSNENLDSGIVSEICFEHFGEEQSKYSVDSLF